MAVKFQGGKAVTLKPTGGKQKTPNDNVRRAYYKMSDGQYALESALTELGDPEVLAAFQKVRQSIDQFHTVLSRKWLWD
jgi:hypothetical protein